MPAMELGMRGTGLSGGFCREVSHFAPGQVPPRAGDCKWFPAETANFRA